jgi:hypothetical protein
MVNSYNSSRCPRSASGLIRHDLCAQLAPLNRYGLADFSAAVVESLIALANASGRAVRALVRRQAGLTHARATS